MWTNNWPRLELISAEKMIMDFEVLQMLAAYENSGLDDAIDAKLQEFMARRKAEIEASIGDD
jgi:trimethylamine:corrinoid methyltransferase-like protein